MVLSIKCRMQAFPVLLPPLFSVFNCCFFIKQFALIAWVEEKARLLNLKISQAFLFHLSTRQHVLKNEQFPYQTKITSIIIDSKVSDSIPLTFISCLVIQMTGARKHFVLNNHISSLRRFYHPRIKNKKVTFSLAYETDWHQTNRQVGQNTDNSFGHWTRGSARP